MALYLSHDNPSSDAAHISDRVFKPGASPPLFIATETARAANIDQPELQRLLESVERLEADFTLAQAEELRLYGEEYDEDGEPLEKPGLELPNDLRDAIINELGRFCSALTAKYGPNLNEDVPPEVDAIARRYRGHMLGAIITEDRQFIYNIWCSYDLFRSTVAYLQRARELNCLILVDTC